MGVPPVGEAGVEDAPDVVATRQELRNSRGVGNVPFDAEMERAQAAQDEEAVQGPGHAAHRVLEEVEALGDRLVAGDRDSQDRVGVAAEIFRGRVEDDVGTELERVLEGRRGERVVDDEVRWNGARLLGSPADRQGGSCDVGQLEVRVGRRLEPEEPRSRGQLLPEDVRTGRQVGVSRLPCPARPMDPLQVAIRPAVDIVADDDLLAARRELGDRSGRGGTARERDSVGSFLEHRHGPLEAVAGRIDASRVVVAATRTIDAVLGVGRGLVDRGRDGAGDLVGLGAGVDGEGLEGVSRRVGGTHRLNHVTHPARAAGADQGLPAGTSRSWDRYTSRRTTVAGSWSAVYAARSMAHDPVAAFGDQGCQRPPIG